MKTTFSHFPGMFENPAPAKIIKKKKKSNQKIHTFRPKFLFLGFFPETFFPVAFIHRFISSWVDKIW